MSKISIIEGDYIETVGGEYVEYVGSATYSTNGKLLITAVDGKNFGNNPKDPPSKNKAKIKSIECITSLEDGSCNDGSGINLQKGIVFGKTYEFRVSEYTSEDHVDPKRNKMGNFLYRC